ncbi:hypothetical protein FB45DRAFT_889736 [Roridomyces roridus]|uniref:DUF6534 domain-containing protein n=1 Tax=Roridomyces roridus TaxID=1738132 RepID=A0AAD7CKG7_9AGAR|nr:hypothetical protein FB45DRAFT_889736 [Roridomyces roridus]
MPSLAQLTLPMFIGTVVNWGLFGMLLIQMVVFFIAFPDDPRLVKMLVVTIFILELVQTLSNGRDMVRVFGTAWGNLEVLDEVGWAWFSTPVMGAIISSVGQAFYARRLYIIGRNIWVPALVASFSVVQLGAGIWTGVKICIATRFSLLQSDNVPATVTWFAATSICDILIVGFTVDYLINQRAKGSFQQTNEMLTCAMLLTVETGLPTAILSIIDLFLFTQYKGTNFHLALCIGLSKVYSNCVLLLLNWRARIGRRPPTEVHHPESAHVVNTGIVFKDRKMATDTTGTMTNFSGHGMRVDVEVNRSWEDSSGRLDALEEEKELMSV